MESDLLVLASSIYACDLAFKRGEREEFTRKIQLNIGLINRDLFLSAIPDIKYALYRLTHEDWDIRISKLKGTPEDNYTQNDIGGKVLLFSGGLDSLAAAVLYGEQGHKIHLISHVTANQVISNSQEILQRNLESKFTGQYSRCAFRVGGISKPTKGFPFPTDQEREETQRTRSFLFLTLAGLVARRRNAADVVMIAENGQMAIHLPLSAARISSFSTHTAHPEFVELMSSLLTRILSHEVKIQNPFLYKTKAEVVQRLATAYPELVKASISCWKASRISGDLNHCGFCVPCLVRRVAIENNKILIPEYKRDILIENIGELDPEDDGKRNLVDFCEFIASFGDNISNAEIDFNFPELTNDSIDKNLAISMYRRFSKEALSVFENYPHVKQIMG